MKHLVACSTARSGMSWCRGKDVWLASLRIRSWNGCGRDAVGEMAGSELVNYGDCLQVDKCGQLPLTYAGTAVEVFGWERSVHPAGQ